MTRLLTGISLAAFMLAVLSPCEALADRPAAKRPLFLHWFKPAYTVGDGTPARHLVSVRVHLDSSFDVVFPDPNNPKRAVAIRGVVRTKDGSHTADVLGLWLSGTRFDGPVVLNEPRGGTVAGFSGAYWPTMIVLSHEEKPTKFLATPLPEKPVGTKRVVEQGAPKPLVTDLRVEWVTRRVQRSADGFETAWYVVRGKLLRVIEGDGEKIGDDVEVAFLANDDLDRDGVLGFRHVGPRPFAASTTLRSPKSERSRRRAEERAFTERPPSRPPTRAKTRSSRGFRDEPTSRRDEAEHVDVRVRLVKRLDTSPTRKRPLYVPEQGVAVAIGAAKVERRAAVDPQSILKLDGNVAAGRELFHSASQKCAHCHCVGDEGVRFGPNLDRVGKLGRERLLEAILAPSARVFRAWDTVTVVTNSGEVHTGFLVERSLQRVVVWEHPNDENGTVTIPRKDVEQFYRSKVSMMPKRDLEKVTNQQLADLVAYLASIQ